MNATHLAKFIYKKYYNSSDEHEQEHEHEHEHKIRNKSILQELKFKNDFIFVNALKFSLDGLNLSLGFYGGQAQEIETESGKVIWTFSESNIPVTCVRYYPKGQYTFISDLAGNILMISLQGKAIPCFKEENEINSFDVDLYGDILISGGKDAFIRVYDLHKNKISRILGCKNQIDNIFYHKLRITNIKLRKRDVFLSSSLDEFVKVWDLRCKNPRIMDIRGPYISGNALDVYDYVILTGSHAEKNCLQLWDIRTGKCFSTINALNSSQHVGQFIDCAKLFQNDRKRDTILASGSGGTLDVISNKNMRIMEQFETARRMGFREVDSWGEYIAFGGKENTLHITKYTV